MSPHFRKWLHIVGSGLALLGVGFVGLRLSDYSGDFRLSSYGPQIIWLLAFAASAYGISNFLLGIAWWNILRMLGVNQKLLWAQKVYGLSQLAKYVPGNVFHFAGRQALGMAEGVSAKPLMKSSIWEFALLSVAGTVFFFLVLTSLSEYVPWWAGFCLGILYFFSLILFSRLKLKAYIVWALSSHVLFLTCSGLVFTLIAEYIHGGFPGHELPWLLVIGAYVVAWLVGLVTPGAPAGVGVRELVLLFLLEDIMAEPDLLLTVFLARLVTVAGDVIYFLFSLFIPKSHRYGANSNEIERT